MSEEKNDRWRELALDDLFSGLGGTILESIRAPFGIFDKDFKILWINKALARIHNCNPASVIGDICYRAFHGCDKMCENCFLEEVRTMGRTVVLERSHLFPDGKTRWGEIHAYPVRAKDRSVAAIVVIIFETTSHIDSLAKYKQYANLLADKLQSKGDTGTPVVRTDHSEEMIEPLSKRETEVLRLIVDGYTNPQISAMLFISGNTVKRHISNLFLKLDVSDRTQAAVLAVRKNLI
jgi:PAS domain S-box-containing protein